LALDGKKRCFEQEEILIPQKSPIFVLFFSILDIDLHFMTFSNIYFVWQSTQDRQKYHFPKKDGACMQLLKYSEGGQFS
jgi:hypothetical protein